MRNKKLIILFSVLLAITLLVVFNSVLFSVQHVNAYCANVERSEYEEQVLSSHKIKRGSSIFFVDKAKVTANVERALGGNVRVLNIEKKFPNRISINYVEEKVYAKVVDGKNTYYLRNDMTVILPSEDQNAINLKLGVTLPDNLNAGDKFTFESQSGIGTFAVVREIFSGLEHCGYYHNEIVNLFEEIDLTGRFVKLTTRTDLSQTGISFEIISTDNLAEKLRFALSVYFSGKVDVTGGTLIVTGTKTASYRNSGGMLEDL